LALDGLSSDSGTLRGTLIGRLGVRFEGEGEVSVQIAPGGVSVPPFRAEGKGKTEG